MKKIFNEKGLTLIEIIVTLAVLGVVVSPLMNMFITSQKINNVSKEEYHTLQIAQKYIENIKSAKTLTDVENMGYYKVGTNKYNVPRPAEDSPYRAEITIEPSGGVLPVFSNESDVVLPVLTIYDDRIEWKSGPGPAQSKPIVNGAVDITIENTEITVSDISHSVVSHDFNIVLDEEISDEISINFVNCTVSGKVYIDNSNDKRWSFEVFGGENPIIISIMKLQTEEVLYNVTVDIYKGAESIKSLQSTTIFKDL